MWQTVISGFIMGALSSFHCIGMCGPLTFILPLNNANKFDKIKGVLLYNIGRVSTYTLLGLALGNLGKRILITTSEQKISVVLGCAIVLFALYTLLRKHFAVVRIATVEQHLQKAMITLSQKRGLSSLYFMGMLNGLLPCGMVSLALTAAVATGSIQGGATFMAAFGSGTLPLMLMFSLFGYAISFPVRNYIKKLMPVMLFAAGALLILRGMNIGIPYISPHIEAASAVSCH